MDTQYKSGHKTPNPNNKNSNYLGVIFLIFGIALLFKTLNFGFSIPRWFLGWEMIMIIIGLVISVNSKFKSTAGIVLLIIGSVFLWKSMISISILQFLFPIAAICFGIYLTKRNRQMPIIHHPKEAPVQDEFDWDKRVFEEDTIHTDPDNRYRQNKNTTFQYEDALKLDVIFSEVKKVIYSKRFLGGTATIVFGSSQINLSHADLQQDAIIDLFQIFGSTKIIVPADWTVSMDVSSVMGEVSDRRKEWSNTNEYPKVLYIKGSSFFGSVMIKNS